MEQDSLIEYFDRIAPHRDRWKSKNYLYYEDLIRFLKFVVPPGKSVLEVGCGTGDLVAALEPVRGIGIDISGEMVKIAKYRYPQHAFLKMNAENIKLNETFDYVIMSDLIGHLHDVQEAFNEIHKITNRNSRIIITYYNFIWEPILQLAERIGLKMPQPRLNWLNQSDIENLLQLTDFEIVKKGQRFLFPKHVPILSSFFNRYLSQLPFFKKLCIYQYIIAKKRVSEPDNSKFSISVVIPAKNEKGNIEDAVARLPRMGSRTEIIFVEGGSTDGTQDEIVRVVDKYQGHRDIKFTVQDGKGKGNAVRKGFEMATGDILCILDADLTVPPEELPKFYDAIASGKAEFVNGCRLVYPLEDEAMRSLNILGNKFFGLMFTWLLDQKFKDTLCGTKVIFKRDYDNLIANRSYFGDFDPFGDFDLIFGASKLNLKIVEIPIRYRQRTYGDTNISRFRHGLMLLRMCVFAMKKIRFI
jgi:ubiquinone/menaquinone biosynthesis C-methylase UbiE